MASLARKNLFHDIPRFLVAQAGIMFSVSLVTIQTGLFNGFTRSTSALIDNTNADVWVASDQMRHLELTLPLPYERLTEAQQVEGVAQAEALISQGALWRRTDTSQIVPVRVIGFDPAGQLFRPWNITQGSLNQLAQPYRVMLDQSDLTILGIDQVGETGEVGAYEAIVTGFTQGNSSVISSAFLYTSLPNANQLANSPVTTPVADPPTPPALTPQNPISFVLVRAEPGQNLELLKQRLEEALPNTRALTQVEMSSLTRTYWQRSTSVGFILGLGAVVGIVVGIVVVGQILYASVSDHLKEFGTLKAMGASDWFIYSVIIEQSLWMAVLGYIPGMGLCVALGTWTLQTQAVQILISPVAATGVFGLTLVMCVGAAVFAIQKVTRIDPAMVFKS